VTEKKAYDFEAIEAAVAESKRGRWFLAEFARRQRSADTEMLLKAIHKLEAAIGEQHLPAGGELLGRNLSAMARALKATEADMRNVSSDQLADGGAVPEGRTAFEDVAARATNLAAGLNATTEALKSIGDDLRQDTNLGKDIASLDEDLSRLAEHTITQNVLGQRITKAMELIAHLQARIQASLGPDEEPGEEKSAENSPSEEALSAGEVSYFDADRELFAPSETAPVPALEIAAEDPENPPHLADMLEDALAGMEGEAASETGEAAEKGEEPADEPAAAAASGPEVQPAQPPADTPASAAETNEAPAQAEAPRTPRVVIVREAPSAAPLPAAGEDVDTAASGKPAADEKAEAPADAETETQAASKTDQAASTSTSEPEPGPETIMKMFADAAAKHGMEPSAPASASSADKEPGEEVKAAPLEPMTPGPEERRRIVVIRRDSSADTRIPLEEAEKNGDEAEA